MYIRIHRSFPENVEFDFVMYQVKMLEDFFSFHESKSSSTKSENVDSPAVVACRELTFIRGFNSCRRIIKKVLCHCLFNSSFMRSQVFVYCVIGCSDLVLFFDFTILAPFMI